MFSSTALLALPMPAVGREDRYVVWWEGGGVGGR